MNILLPVRRISGFGLSFLLGFVPSIFAIQVMIQKFGSAIWAHVTISQSYSVLPAAIVAWGWSVTGPTSVAKLTNQAAKEYLFQSLRIRGRILLLALPITMAAYAVLFPNASLEEFATIFSGLLAAMTSPWYMIGKGQPKRLILLDSLPRSLAVILAIVSAQLGGSVILFVVIQGLGVLTSVLMLPVLESRAVANAKAPDYVEDIKSTSEQPHSRAAGAVISIASTIYVNLPIVILGRIFSIEALAPFVLADKLAKLAVSATIPVTQWLQSWIPTGEIDIRAKSRKALNSTLCFGLVTVITFIFVAIYGTQYLAGATIEAPMPLIFAFSISVGSIVISRNVGLAILASLEALTFVATSTVIALLLGLTLVYISATGGSLVGAAWSLALTEFLVTILQIIRLKALLNRI
jgi:hypothetical protein